MKIVYNKVKLKLYIIYLYNVKIIISPKIWQGTKVGTESPCFHNVPRCFHNAYNAYNGGKPYTSLDGAENDKSWKINSFFPGFSQMIDESFI